jgi:hypothetical protein
MSPDIIKNNMDYPWDFKIISLREDIPWDYFRKNLDIFWDHLYHPYIFDIRSDFIWDNTQFAPEFIKDSKFAELSGSITFDIIKKYPVPW